MLPIYIDIDGTLTDQPGGKGEIIKSRIAMVKRMIKAGQPVVIWSAAGCIYAKEFVKANGIDAIAAIGKPKLCIDDMKSIKWNGLKVRTPGYIDVLDALDSFNG